jgi:hypothetical protein
MSMLRKTTITVAIVGAGLGSLSGAAFANTHHGSSHDSHDSHGSSASCTNNVKALNSAQGGGFVDVAGGAQTIVPVNVCHILNDNKILNGNVLNIGGTTTTLPAPPPFPGI